jgi:hypothetical protein
LHNELQATVLLPVSLALLDGALELAGWSLSDRVSDLPVAARGSKVKSFLTKQLLSALFISAFTGCAAHRSISAEFNGLVDPHCLTKPLLLKHCVPGTSPLHCRSIEASYKPGCERLEVEKEVEHVQPDLSHQSQTSSDRQADRPGNSPQ